jgi:hypothetical protein
VAMEQPALHSWRRSCASARCNTHCSSSILASPRCILWSSSSIGSCVLVAAVAAEG